MSHNPYTPPTTKPDEPDRFPLRKIFSLVLATLGWAFLLLAALTLGRAIYASATIPAGQVNEAGFGIVASLFFAVIGLIALGIGRLFRGKPRALS